MAKKKDGRSNNGGARNNAGRRPKADEERIRGLALSGLEKVYGSEENAWVKIAELSKESFPHLKMLFEYLYGKPKERLEVDGENPFNVVSINVVRPE